MKSSKALLEFYKAWLAGEASGGYTRTEYEGLCGNLWDFVSLHLHQGISTSEEELAFRMVRDNLYIEMKQQFISAGLSSNFPFNPSYEHYILECQSKACPSNNLRVQWVKDRLSEGE